MAYDLAIDVSVNTDGLDSAADKVDVLTKKTKELGDARRSAGESAREGRLSSGPEQGLLRAREGLDKLRDQGHDTNDRSNILVRDALGREARAEKAVDRQAKLVDGENQSNAMMTAILTSRIGPGGMYPLVNKVIGAMGVPGAVAAAGIGATFALAQGASDVIGQASAIHYGPGGTPREIGQAMAIGATPDKIMGFGDDLRRGTFGSAYMHSRGINDLGPWTDDKTGNYLKGLEAMRDASDDTTKRRILRDMPSLGDKAWINDLSEGDWQGLKTSMGNMGTQQQREASASFTARQQRVSNAYSRIVTGPVGQAGMSLAEGALGSADITQSGIDDYARWALDAIGFARGGPAGAWASHKLGLGVAWAARGLGHLAGGGQGPVDTKRNSRFPVKGGGSSGAVSAQPATSFDELGLPYRTMGDDLYMSGGGARLRGSVPPGYAYQQLDTNFTSQAINLGAFSVN